MKVFQDKKVIVFSVTYFLFAILFYGCQSKSDPLPVTILHWNDFHAQNLPFVTTMGGDTVEVGGAAYLAGLLDSLRTSLPGALALHAGDEFTGTPICSFTQGQSQIDLLNLMIPDAFALGNHEFDYGWGILQERLVTANFPVLCCNVVDSSTGRPVVKSSIIIERNGVKIGVIGVIQQKLAGSVIKGALAGLSVEDPVPIVKRLLHELERSTDIQVALTHQSLNDDKRLARNCPGLDVIVGGHQHLRIFEPLLVNGVPILQAGSKGEYLGFFQAQVDTAADRIISYEGKLIPVISRSIRPRDDVMALVEAQEKIISAEVDRVIGYLKEPWIRASDGESNVGNWTADAMVRMTGCDIAFINSGGFRKNLPAGPVTVRDLWELHPFNDRLMKFEISGRDLHRAMSYHVTSNRRLLQVGGIRYRARKSTGEILEMTVGGKPVQLDRRYTVITNEFVAGHIEDYLGLSLPESDIEDTGWIDRLLVEEAFIQEGTVSSRKDGRIILEE